MSNRDKVVKGLEHCDFGISDTCYEKECPYYQSHDCTDELKNDILALLKEQPEIVRCEDCGHQGNRCLGVYCMFIECKKTGRIHHETWFCADGKRMEGR